MQSVKSHALLQQAALALGVPLDAPQQQALLTYLAQLQRWNKTYNLTAIRDPQQMLVQHLFDSLSVIAPLRRHWPQQAIHVIDVGSGAGLPGVVIAVLQPHWQVTCVDAVEKKAVFIQQVARGLGLSNLSSVHGRIETLQNLTGACVISRAFAALQDFIALAGARVAPHGVLLAMKGKQPDAELHAIAQNTDWHVSLIEPLQVPLLDAQRCLIWLQRKESHEAG